MMPHAVRVVMSPACLPPRLMSKFVYNYMASQRTENRISCFEYVAQPRPTVRVVAVQLFTKLFDACPASKPSSIGRLLASKIELTDPAPPRQERSVTLQLQHNQPKAAAVARRPCMYQPRRGTSTLLARDALRMQHNHPPYPLSGRPFWHGGIQLLYI